MRLQKTLNTSGRILVGLGLALFVLALFTGPDEANTGQLPPSGSAPAVGSTSGMTTEVPGGSSEQQPPMAAYAGALADVMETAGQAVVTVTRLGPSYPTWNADERNAYLSALALLTQMEAEIRSLQPPDVLQSVHSHAVQSALFFGRAAAVAHDAVERGDAQGLRSAETLIAQGTAEVDRAAQLLSQIVEGPPGG